MKVRFIGIEVEIHKKKDRPKVRYIGSHLDRRGKDVPEINR